MNKSFLIVTGTLMLTLGAIMLWFAVTNFSTESDDSASDVETSQFPTSGAEDDFVAPQNELLQQLTSATWVWDRADMKDDLVIIPMQTGAFTLSFAPGGAVRGTTDCNAINSIYSLENGILQIEPFSMTRKYCEGSQELVFTNLFTEASTVLISADGNLTLLLPFDRGSIFFTRDTTLIE